METKSLNSADIFQNRIFRYLKDYFPHLFENEEEVKQMIIDRAENAKQAYSKAIRNGQNHIEAMEEANEILHADLEFSPIEYIQELFEEKKNKFLSIEQVIPIYQKTKPIFDKYGKDIEGTEGEENLIEELMPYIN